MSLNETYRIANIISKYILGDLTLSEEAELQEWLDASPKNQVLFREFNRKHFFTEKKQAEQNADYETAWKDFLKRKQQQNRKRQWRTGFLKVAAAAAILIAIGISLYLFQPRIDIKREDSIANGPVKTIMPGNKQATLTLSDGREIPLSDTSQQVLSEMGLSRIQLTDAGILYLDSPDPAEPTVYNALQTPSRGEFALTLADGTRVWLNAESRLKYPTHFTGTERHVILEGEAYFEVAKNDEMPFVVEVENTFIQVVGTSFNVKGYRKEAFVYTTLVEGKVRLRTSDHMVDLEPNEQGVIDLSSKDIQKKKVDVALYTAWQKGRFIFDSQPLHEIMDDMSRWYGIAIEFTDPTIRDIPFSGNLKRYDNLNKIIEMLQKTEDITFTQKGGTLYIGKQ